MNYPSKMPWAETSIFPVMTGLANQYGAVNLAQGFPGFGADPELLNLICDYTQKGFNQYAPLMGLLALKEKISQKLTESGARYYHPETEICITAGATQAIYSAISSIVFDGDEVIVIEPAYDCYVPSIVLNKGIPIRSELKPKTYEIDWEDIRTKVTSRTKCIIINTPHNPTGAVWTKKDIDALRSIVRDSNILILADEVYEHLVYDGLPHLSIANEKDLAEKAFVVYSFGKTYHLTGWRAGYVVAPKELMVEFVKCHQFQIYAVNTPIQYAINDYSKNKDAYLELNSFFENRRNFFIDAVNGSRFKTIEPKGTYFTLLDYSEITSENDREFANRLTIEHKVASIPISVFFESKRQDQVLRFCFAKKQEELEKAAELLLRV